MRYTNIESSEEEMKVLDSFLQRCWQMGWLTGCEHAERTCKWSQDENGIYYGTCGIAWEFTYGDVRENGVDYCPKCGAKVEVS